MKLKVGKKWQLFLPIYQYFADNDPNYDFSDQAKQEMYDWETYGTGNLNLNLFNNEKLNGYNGFAIGKHWMDVTIAMWNEDIKTGLLKKEELYQEYPNWHWWLNKVVK